jgi:hypothetical protein
MKPYAFALLLAWHYLVLSLLVVLRSMGISSRQEYVSGFVSWPYY